MNGNQQTNGMQSKTVKKVGKKETNFFMMT